MKSRFFSALSFCALLIAAPVAAQQSGHIVAQGASTAKAGPATSAGPAPASVDSSRRYDSQALRFESRWGSADIKRGTDGVAVGTVGWFRGIDVENLVAASPRAVAEARSFKTDNFRGSLATAAGAVTLITGIVVTSNSSNNAASPVLIILGVGGVAWGAQHLQLGYSALSRAFWWYNRELTR
ncbi:MAG TPA: hypothetical protein VJ825_02495 [Gemmatimonadaceae bacterium]|nr:hypothetical protein [Gemmatimonadaceae bacterium]